MCLVKQLSHLPKKNIELYLYIKKYETLPAKVSWLQFSWPTLYSNVRHTTKKIIVTLCDEVFLKLEQKFKVQKVIRGQRLLTDDRLHSLHVFADGVASVLHTMITHEHSLQYSECR